MKKDSLGRRLTERGKPKRFANDAANSNTDNCIIWPYTINHAGYGHMRVDSKYINAHRYVLQLATGNQGDGMDACHGACHNRLCINPRHLYWGTRKENFADKNRDGTVNRGERNGRSKLTVDRVMSIFHSSGSHQSVADREGISRICVSDIKSGRRWGWLTGANS